MPPSLPHELISIIAGRLHPAAWNTARALSVVYRDAVHEVTKRPEALGNLLAAMEFANCPPAYLYYDDNDEPAERLLAPHFPKLLSRVGPGLRVRLPFAQLNLKLMLDLTCYYSHCGFNGDPDFLTDFWYVDTREKIEMYVQANRDRFRGVNLGEEVEEDPNLLSTLRWAMLRMTDRVRFAGFNVERNIEHANSRDTQFQPLLWEWK